MAIVQMGGRVERLTGTPSERVAARNWEYNYKAHSITH
jgi:hypothetical protein